MASKKLNKMERQVADHGNINEYLTALAKIGCNPTWQTFEKTYNWFTIKKKLSLIQQDEYQELWLRAYKQLKGVSFKLMK